MTGRYQAYPEYKKSGIEWLGDVPVHWISSNLKLYCNVTDGSHHSPKIQNDGYPFISVTDVGENKIDFENCKRIAEDDYYRLVKEGCKPKVGNVLLTKDGTIGRATIVKDSDPDFVILSSLGLLSPSHKLSNKYLYYFLVSGINVDQMNSMIHGSALKRMTINKIDSLRIVFPEITEQQKIIEFLDYETTKINKLLCKQEKLITLLKEKRQAVISQAVTKGITPEAVMKESGIDSIGQIPEHWSIGQLKYLLTLNPKKSQVANKKELTCNFIPMDKLKKDSLKLDEVVSVDSVFDGYTYFENEDVLIAKVTPCFENQNMVVARNLENGLGFGSSEIYVLRTKSQILNDYLYYRLQEDKFMQLATGAMTGAGGLKRVPSEFLLTYSIAFPDIDEQKEIVENLQVKLIKIDQLIEQALAAVNLMKERKTALISAAVTGKIDVRNFKEDVNE